MEYRREGDCFTFLVASAETMPPARLTLIELWFHLDHRNSSALLFAPPGPLPQKNPDGSGLLSNLPPNILAWHGSYVQG